MELFSRALSYLWQLDVPLGEDVRVVAGDVRDHLGLAALGHGRQRQAGCEK